MSVTTTSSQPSFTMVNVYSPCAGAPLVKTWTSNPADRRANHLTSAAVRRKETRNPPPPTPSQGTNGT